MARYEEPFLALPFRLHEAWRRGEVSLRQVALITFLAAEAWRSGAREAAFTIAGLREATGYPLSRDTLRHDLEGLRPKWINFVVEERQRQPIIFRLTGAAVVASETVSRSSAESELPPTPQTCAAAPQSARPANAVPEPLSATSQLEKLASVASTEKRRVRKEQEQDQVHGRLETDLACFDCGENEPEELLDFGRHHFCRRCAGLRAQARKQPKLWSLDDE